MSLNPTNIEWATHSWNPATGCLHTTADCPCADNCYAAETARTRLNYDFRTVKFHPDRLGDVTPKQKPAVIFVGSMTDMMGSWWSDDEIKDVISCCQSCMQHIFLWLTKKPERYAGFPWPANCWLGASPLRQEEADWMTAELLKAGAKHYFLSQEPLLGPMEIAEHLPCPDCSGRGYYVVGSPFKQPLPDTEPCQRCIDAAKKAGQPIYPGSMARRTAPYIDWIIAGGMTGPRARPSHPDWFRSLRDQCAAADVPFLFKQWGVYQPVAGTIPQVLPGDICISENGFYDTVPNQGYVCLANESDGEWMRPLMPRPRMIGKATQLGNHRKLDGQEYLQMPAPIAEIMALRKRKAS